ncbi:condensation domain-containing protein [Streptomyces sp. SPB162]|uniref:condensation domain-containing protein n=1 Tax=Streptomyces sp. SPB162 TaxID=2940560 RepID=UPI00240715B2|nr:condensation domain-containing protein [Streptomyces sp. SPB162]MDF9815661.1 acyl-CoA synthetase (AMP-forming)/AMP-acid ligase II/acyl carrier protein [Streptomyces sp. SPB162]
MVVQDPARTAATRKETDLWLLERLVPGSGVNNLSLTFDVAGETDAAALSRALTLVVRKYDILRTVFRTSETDLAKEVLAADAITSIDVTPIDVTEDGVQAAVEAFVAEPFALDGSPLVRAARFRRSGGAGDVVSVALHHLVFDAMSTVTLLGELISAYQAPDAYSTTPVAAVVETEPSEESVDFWRDQLRGFRGADDGLWYGNPASATPNLAGDTLQYLLSDDALAVVARLQRELRAPEAVILLAAYYLLLAQHGAGSDIVVGSPVSVRPPGHEGAIGYHVNVLPLRVRMDPAKPFKRLVNRARAVFLESLGEPGVTAESVLDEVRDGDSSSWRNSLFNHLFNYVPGGTSGTFEVAGHPAKIRGVENGFSKFDLEFFFMPEPAAAKTTIRAVFRTQVFSPAEVTLLLARYDALLCALGDQLDRPIGEVSGWSPADHAAVLAGHRDGLPEALLGPSVAPFSGYPKLAAKADPSSLTRAFVAAPDGTELPVGVRGELCLADDVITRTGDVARWLPDGRIEILGRLDRRVTVQGLAFGLEEVDAALLAHPAVDAAVTVAVGGVLVAFVATAGDAGAGPDLLDQLRKQVRTDLPGPAEPARIIVTEGLPTVNGAPDLQGLRLRAEELLRTGPTPEPVDTTELTRALIALWKQFLQREDLDADSGFFTSGGHSLLAVQLLQRVKRTTGIQVKIRLADLFAHPTPEKLSAYISSKKA